METKEETAGHVFDVQENDVLHSSVLRFLYSVHSIQRLYLEPYNIFSF